MKKFAIRVLTLAMFATPLLSIPLVSPAAAATDGSKHVKKHTGKVQRAPAVQSAKSQKPFPSLNEDPDRKAGGGY